MLSFSLYQFLNINQYRSSWTGRLGQQEGRELSMALLVQKAQRTTGSVCACACTYIHNMCVHVCLSFKVPIAPAEASQQELLHTQDDIFVLTGVTKKGKVWRQLKRNSIQYHNQQEETDCIVYIIHFSLPKFSFSNFSDSSTELPSFHSTTEFPSPLLHLPGREGETWAWGVILSLTSQSMAARNLC